MPFPVENEEWSRGESQEPLRIISRQHDGPYSGNWSHAPCWILEVLETGASRCFAVPPFCSHPFFFNLTRVDWMCGWPTVFPFSS